MLRHPVSCNQAPFTLPSPLVPSPRFAPAWQALCIIGATLNILTEQKGLLLAISRVSTRVFYLRPRRLRLGQVVADTTATSWIRNRLLSMGIGLQSPQV